ncbi:hypothetical protein ACJX0J_040110, partial [Zea mays]
GGGAARAGAGVVQPHPGHRLHQEQRVDREAVVRRAEPAQGRRHAQRPNPVRTSRPSASSARRWLPSTRTTSSPASASETTVHGERQASRPRAAEEGRVPDLPDQCQGSGVRLWPN